MPTATLNGVSFAAGVASALDATTRRAPKTITPDARKIESTVEAIDGTANQFVYGAKTDYELTWEKVNELTRAAVRAIYDLTTSFTAVLPQGTITAYCQNGDHHEEEAFTLPDGTTKFYDITLKVRQV